MSTSTIQVNVFDWINLQTPQNPIQKKLEMAAESSHMKIATNCQFPCQNQSTCMLEHYNPSSDRKHQRRFENMRSRIVIQPLQCIQMLSVTESYPKHKAVDVFFIFAVIIQIKYKLA